LLKFCQKITEYSSNYVRFGHFYTYQIFLGQMLQNIYRARDQTNGYTSKAPKFD